jgi:hypothetical protein
MDNFIVYEKCTIEFLTFLYPHPTPLSWTHHPKVRTSLVPTQPKNPYFIHLCYLIQVTRGQRRVGKSALKMCITSIRLHLSLTLGYQFWLKLYWMYLFKSFAKKGVESVFSTLANTSQCVSDLSNRLITYSTSTSTSTSGGDKEK